MAKDLGIARRRHRLDDHQLLARSSAACCCSAAAPPTCSGAAACSSPAWACSPLASLAPALAGGATTLLRRPRRAGPRRRDALARPRCRSSLTTFTAGKPRRRRSASWGAVGGAGAAIGVLLGGMLTELVDWRAIFFINLPGRPRRSAVAARKLVPADAAPAAVARPRPARRGARHRPASAHSSTRSRRPRRGLDLDADARHRRRRARRARRASRCSSCARRSRCCASSAWATAPSAAASLMMLAASAVLFGSFLLSSLYLQNVLGTGPLETGLAFLPLAVAIGVGVHVGSHAHQPRRRPRAAGRRVRRRGRRDCCCCPASTRTAATSPTCCPAC